MVSSVRAGMIAQEKQKKIQRRLAKEGVVNAVEERIEPEDNQQEHTQVKEREIPTETSDSNSIVESGEIKAEINKPKKKSKKATKKK
jgi:formaldehyde-activating enzyme involved in methanogenesis